MNTSNRDLQRVFNWGSPPMRAQSRGRWGKKEQRSARMIFQYCRSTLSPIFTADYISLLPYPNLRDHFGTAARARSSRRSSRVEQIARLRRGERREKERTRKRDLVNFISLLVHFDPRDRFRYHSAISARITAKLILRP